MRARTVLGAVLAATIAAAGCDGDFDGVLVVGPDVVDLVGLWTGVEEIGGSGAAGSSLLIGDPLQNGFRFPIALDLRLDRTFILRSFAFAARDYGEATHVCAGVFDVDGNTLKFFPDNLCRPLPLSAYTIGRFAPDGLILTADTQRPVALSGDPVVGDIRVRIRVERDD